MGGLFLRCVKNAQGAKWGVRTTKAGKESTDWLSEVNEEILLADGFDEAIVGYIERAGIRIV